MITLRQLRYFHVLSQCLHFGRAATKLHITQPPLSVNIRQLEAVLGFSLFERSNKSVSLTPAGVVFADHVSGILTQVQVAQDAARLAAEGGTGKATVAFIPSMLFSCLPLMLKTFQDQYPQIDLHIQELNSTSQIRQLTHQSIDIGFIHGAPCPTDFGILPLEEEQLVCCVPSCHNLSQRKSIGIRDLANENILIFEREFSMYHYDRIVALLRMAELTPYTQFQVKYWFTLVALVSQKLGVAIVPDSLRKSNFGDVNYIDIHDITLSHNIHMIWKRDSLSPSAKHFVSHVKNQYLKLSCPTAD